MRIHEGSLALGELRAGSDNYCRGAGSTTTSLRKFVNTLKKRSMNSWPAVCPGKMPPPPPAASLAT